MLNLIMIMIVVATIFAVLKSITKKRNILKVNPYIQTVVLSLILIIVYIVVIVLRMPLNVTMAILIIISLIVTIYLAVLFQTYYFKLSDKFDQKVGKC